MTDTSSNTELCGCGRGMRQAAVGADGRLHTYSVCKQCSDEEKKRMELMIEEDLQLILNLQVLRFEVLSYFDSRYLQHWLSHFKLIRSKKEVWEILHKEGVVDIGISTFYERIKRSTL